MRSFGDPIVLIGGAGGGGGRGRQQVKHQLLLDILGGFYKYELIDEHNTSRKTTCCHQDIYTTRALGRSRGCKHCHHGKTKVDLWDRDTGAAWYSGRVPVRVLHTYPLRAHTVVQELCVRLHFAFADRRTPASNDKTRSAQHRPTIK